jgi:hypothetical protein
MSKLNYANTSLISKIDLRITTIFKKKGSLDVKCDHLIC